MLHDFLKSLCIWICVPIYGLIPKIYSIFFNLANTRFLKSDLVEQFSANLYVLVSVIMLFGFSITILSAIVNPDLLSDSKKGVPAMFKRAIIGLALMVIIPFAFDEMYKIQENVMTNSLIEKIIVGADFSCDENDDSCEVGGNGGQVIAGTLIQSVLRPAEDTVETSQNIEEDYNNMIQKDITKINRITDSINITREDAGSTTEDGNHVFHFDGLIAIIVGAGVCYILILFALDMAVRIFKLAFLELTAPISIVGYIAAGDKIISSWFKEVGKTFLDVFIRIAAIAFYLFLINNLSSFMVDFEGKTWRYVLIAFLIIGMLIFAKQVPDMIGKIFGIDMKSQGGIAGRLGNMAGVGNVAKKAWEAVRNPIAAAAGIGSAVGGTISHLGAGVTGAWQQGKLKAKEIRDNRGKAAGFRGFVSGAGRAIGSILSTPSSTVRSLKSGVQNKNLSPIVGEWDRDRELHPEGSTFGGRTIDKMRSFVGAKSSADAEIAKLDKEKVRIDAEIDYNNSIQQLTKSIKDAVKNSIEKSDSNINMNLVTRDKNGKMIAYNGNYNQIQERINAERTAAANLTGQARIDEFNRLSSVENVLNAEKKKKVTQYLDDVLDSTSINHAQSMKDLGPGTTNTILQQKSEFEARTNKKLISETVLDKENKAAGDALYKGNGTTASLYSQQAQNQKARRERDSSGNLTEYGKKVQDNNAVNARNNNGSSSNSSKK